MAITDGLRALYHFNNNWDDSSDNGHTLTPTGATFVSGKLNEASNYDGTDDVASNTSLISSIANDTVGTIAFWMHIDVDDNTFHSVFTISRNADAVLSEFVVGIDLRTVPESDWMYVNPRVDGVSQYNARTPLNSLNGFVGTYFNVIITLDGTEPKVYFNNVEQTLDFGVPTDKTVWCKDFIADATSPADTVNFGAVVRNGSASQFYNGGIDEFALWNRVITSDERAQFYNSGNGIELSLFSGFPFFFGGGYF